MFGGSQMTLASTGFRVPAEEDQHQLTFMQWPVIPQVYDSKKYLRHVQSVIAQIANTIAAFEPVVMLAHPDHHNSARKLLSDTVELWDIPTDDLWCRDSGPLFAKDGNGALSIRNVNFNGWGNRFHLPNDIRIAERVSQRLGLPLFDSGVIGEAGGAETSGHGLLMANESSWVNTNRNPGLNRDQIETRLLAAFGADRMIWGKGVKNMDITDDHIDGLARFTGNNRVLMLLETAPWEQDPYTLSARALHRDLVKAGLEVETIPFAYDGRITDPMVMGSYVNYYVCNGAVIGSQMGDAKTDPIARAALSRHYPGREIILLDTDALSELGGGIHCATQQMPA